MQLEVQILDIVNEHKLVVDVAKFKLTKSESMSMTREMVYVCNEMHKYNE